MLDEEHHLSSTGKIIRFLNGDDLYPVNRYQSLLLATASELAALRIAAQRTVPLADLSAWEPCCGGGPAAVALKHLGLGYVQATDISPEAVTSCVANAEANDLRLDRALTADLLADGDDRRYDLICCNPPCGPDIASDGSGPAMDVAVRGGETGVEVTCRLIEQARSRLTPGGSLLFVAVSTTDIGRLGLVLDRHFPGRWRAFPSTPIAAPYRRVDARHSQWLTDVTTPFRPLVWRRDDGWYWRLSWVIEATNEPSATFRTGFPLLPYGIPADRDPDLMNMIQNNSDDAYWLRKASSDDTAGPRRVEEWPRRVEE
jgi:hypothetical protein